MIKAIKLNHCTPYQQTEISDCKKINFIFGANGSGKSTISAFLSGIQDPRYSTSSIEWDNELHERIEVYNKEFRRTNLQQEMQGIFTLGSATIEDIRELERLKNDLKNRTSEWETTNTSYRNKEAEKKKREEQFKEDAWDQILKKNEDDFQKAFEGLRGSKDRFLSELKKRIQGIPDHQGTVCDRQELMKRARTLFVTRPERRERFTIDVGGILKYVDEVRNDEIWNTVIAGSDDIDISALIKELGNSSWVGQGRQYLRAGSTICPFCQQETITDEFRHKLESFFDTEYKRKTDRMALLCVDYQNQAKILIDVIDAAIQGRDSSIETGKLNVEVYNAKRELLKFSLEENIRLINEKIAEPEKRIKISGISDAVQEIIGLLQDANALIETHNNLVNQKNKEEILLRDDVWATCISDSQRLIDTYQRDITKFDRALVGIDRSRTSQKTMMDHLVAEVEEKGKNITSVQPAIDEINRSLRAYGFTSFSIYPAEGRENYYCIKRSDGTYATNTLSEGEETFLTFLYFMQRAKGSTDQARVSDKKIIVLDDPISSLDSTILYIVGAIVKDLSKKIHDGEGDVNQLFILTHNVFFHKEASFIDGRTQQRNDVNFWIVRKNNDVSTIVSYGMTNPISTSYELLWHELKDNTGASLISIQNTMRRIIENYFGMLGGRRDDYIVEQFESTEDKMIARSLLYWINDGSHSIPDDLFIDPYTDAVPRYKEVFRGIYEKSGHLAHYNMMMGIEDTDVDAE